MCALIQVNDRDRTVDLRLGKRSRRFARSSKLFACGKLSHKLRHSRLEATGRNFAGGDNAASQRWPSNQLLHFEESAAAALVSQRAKECHVGETAHMRSEISPYRRRHRTCPDRRTDDDQIIRFRIVLHGFDLGMMFAQRFDTRLEEFDETEPRPGIVNLFNIAAQFAGYRFGEPACIAGTRVVDEESFCIRHDDTNFNFAASPLRQRPRAAP